MTFEQFRGSGPIPGWTQRAPRTRLQALNDPLGYEADPLLVRAVNVALSLGMPLLLTGEPGTGKTQLAYRLAAELTGGFPLRFDTKSSSQANDLFFTFDSMRYFAQTQINALQEKSPPAAREFVGYNALGEAILRTHPRAAVEDLLPSGFPDYEHGRSVVLIDEIDKAPRDFPNDLLNQIENREFRVQELRPEPVRANPDVPPVAVIITSNSEKQLPDPFLRRCVYHHIQFPEDRICEIVTGRLGDLPVDAPAFDGARKFFFAVRGAAGLEKKPSTSELLDWLLVLRRAGLVADQPFAAQRELAAGCLGALAKTGADMERARKLLASFA